MAARASDACLASRMSTGPSRGLVARCPRAVAQIDPREVATRLTNEGNAWSARSRTARAAAKGTPFRAAMFITQ